MTSLVKNYLYYEIIQGNFIINCITKLMFFLLDFSGFITTPEGKQK